MLAPDTAAVSETSASIVAASAPAGAPLSVSAALTLSSAISAAPAGRMATPLDVATSATTTVFDAVQQVSAVAMPLSTDFRTDAAAQAASASVVNEVPPVAAPTAMSNPTADTLFTSHRSAFDRIAAPANIAKSASAWSWLAAIESSWNSTYQDEKDGFHCRSPGRGSCPVRSLMELGRLTTENHAAAVAGFPELEPTMEAGLFLFERAIFSSTHTFSGFPENHPFLGTLPGRLACGGHPVECR